MLKPWHLQWKKKCLDAGLGKSHHWSTWLGIVGTGSSAKHFFLCSSWRYWRLNLGSSEQLLFHCVTALPWDVTSISVLQLGCWVHGWPKVTWWPHGRQTRENLIQSSFSSLPCCISPKYAKPRQSKYYWARWSHNLTLCKTPLYVHNSPIWETLLTWWNPLYSIESANIAILCILS